MVHVPSKQLVKIYFANRDSRFCHVVFKTTTSPFEEGSTVRLFGWQVKSNRHNVVCITEYGPPRRDLAGLDKIIADLDFSGINVREKVFENLLKSS